MFANANEPNSNQAAAARMVREFEVEAAMRVTPEV
jgi:hypothetical protein